MKLHKNDVGALTHDIQTWGFKYYVHLQGKQYFKAHRYSPAIT